MDTETINPFILAVSEILGQFGLSDVKRTGLSLGGKDIKVTDAGIKLDVSGDKTGVVGYSMTSAAALKIVSSMMGGAAISAIDDMTKSALSEVASMMSANASTALSGTGVNLKLSVPAYLDGGSTLTMSADKSVKVDFDVAGGELSLYITL